MELMPSREPVFNFLKWPPGAEVGRCQPHHEAGREQILVTTVRFEILLKKSLEVFTLLDYRQKTL
jgi:hypothetical protein